MNTTLRGLLTVGAMSLAIDVNATTIFSDDFNAENGGVGALNYNSFAQWTVGPGTVDLVGNGFFDFYPGNGLFVDLDGSTGSAGTMTSLGIPVTPGQYVLSFMLGGSRRGDVNQVNVDVETGFASANYTLNSSDPLAGYSLPFLVGSATSINLVFANSGGDNLGAILDNVRLERLDQPGVPDGGATVILLGMSLLALGAGQRLGGRFLRLGEM